MSYRSGYRGVGDPTNGFAGFFHVVLTFVLTPVVFGIIGAVIGSTLGGQSSGYGAFIGVVVGLIVAIQNAVTMPDRVRRARRMRQLHNDLYDRL